MDWDNATQVAEVERLNPVGTLPIMVLDSGQVLSQNLAIQTYLAGQVPERNLLPKGGEERAVALNWLSFVAADLHKAFSPLFGLQQISEDEKVQSSVRNWATGIVHGHLAHLNRNLQGKDYLLGKQFSVADAYCFVVSNWTKWLEIPTEKYGNLNAYLGRVASRPAVQKVLKEEGIG